MARTIWLRRGGMVAAMSATTALQTEKQYIPRISPGGGDRGKRIY